LLRVGLCLLVCAAFPAAVLGQVKDTSKVRRDTTIVVPVPRRGDSTLVDSLFKRDSARAAAALKRDTIKAPLAEAEGPPVIAVSGSYRWDRTALFATGAFSLQDLLDRVPGITGFRADWFATPQSPAYLGNAGRLRVFYDGVQLDELDPRNRGILDLSQVQIWTLEEVRIERGADEIRVYARSWRVDRTTPSTRTDVTTGDQQTNLYRGFFGRRYDGGQALQAAAQQYGTTPSRAGVSSDQLAMLARLGWSRGPWSVDGFILRTNRNRGLVVSEIGPASLPTLVSSRTDAYLRGGVGDPDRGAWAQVVASALSYDLTGNSAAGTTTTGTGGTGTTNSKLTDTTLSRAQYVVAAGLTKWGARLSATERVRMPEREHTPALPFHVLNPVRKPPLGPVLATPSVRASYESRFVSVSAFAEGKGLDSASRAEVMGQFTPFNFLRFGGAVSRVQTSRAADSIALFIEGADSVGPVPGQPHTATFVRGEVGLRVLGLWLSGGMVRRDSVSLPALRVYDTTFVQRREGPATGTFAAIRGTIYEALKVDVSAMRWNDSTGFYRPRYQSRSELYLTTNLLNRIPSGNFGLVLSGVHEYRSNVRFPTGGQPGFVTVPGSRQISARLEIRILSAVAFLQSRNLVGERYSFVPNFFMPRQNTFYGVRWEFWN
jgi:hypothetical protein